MDGWMQGGDFFRPHRTETGIHMDCWRGACICLPTPIKVVAELLLDEPPAISLQPFSLRRFDTPTHRKLMQYRGRRRVDQPVGEQW